MVSDAFIPYQQTLYKSHGFFQTARSTSKSYNLIPTGLQPIIKWPGGKEKELKYILPNAPQFKRYFEPFVGGGSVFMAIRAKEYYINDLSSELVALYNNIAKSDKSFFIYLEAIDKSWERAAKFLNKNSFVF
ncbi:MAG: DNA adenine methylase, partial [Prevotella sp.]|nr:DNA adenine methylase [Prevotella sp.]